MEKIILKNASDTSELGRRIAEALQPGSVIALTGPLGAGKTALSQAIAKALGVTEHLTSPTFTVLCEYESGRLPVYHFDVYRVHDEDDLFELGFEEYLHGNGVCLVEWADLVEELLPEKRIKIDLQYGASEDERTASIEW